jgi:hypothetical protein
MVTGLLASLSIEVEDMTPFKKLKEAGIPVIFFDRVPTAEGYYKVCHPMLKPLSWQQKPSSKK